MLRFILFIVLPVLLQSFQLPKLRTSVLSSRQMNIKMLLSPHDIIDSFTSLSHLHPQLINDHIPSFLLSLDDTTEAVANSASAAAEAVSPYSKVDKTGVIGFIASYVEGAIDGGHSLLQSVGLKYSYGFSIIIFTLFGK